MTQSKRTLIVGAVAVIAVASTVYLVSSALPTCSSATVTTTLERIINDQMINQPKYAWLKSLAALPASPGEGNPFVANISNQREGRSDTKIRHCAADLTLDVNNRWVDEKMKQLSAQPGSDQDKKLSLGIVGISRVVGQASGSKLQTSLDYAVQKTDAGDVYVSIE